MTNPIDIEEGRRICAAATEGPWEVRVHDGLAAITHPHGWVIDGGPGNMDDLRDSEFIAHVRTAYPAALDELERLRGVLAKISSIASSLDDEAAAGIAWQQRPKGGQHVGHSTSFANTPPSGIVAIKRSMRWIREALDGAKVES